MLPSTQKRNKINILAGLCIYLASENEEESATLHCDKALWYINCIFDTAETHTEEDVIRSYIS